MKFFSLFSKKLKPDWIFSASHTLWRVIFSHNGSIVCEVRNTDEKKVSFSCIDAATGKELWSNKDFNEQWWIGIEGIADDKLFLHGFKKPDMPEHRGIICADLRSGNELWRNMTSSFLTVHHSDLFGFKDLFERRVYYRMEMNSGAIVEELQSLPDGIEGNVQLEKTDFNFPEPLGPELNELRSLGSLIKSDPNDEKAKAEFITTKRHHIISAYSRNNESDGELKNTLSILNTTTKKQVYFDVLNGSTPYPVPDSFFMDGNRVYYIKERKTLVALELP